MAAAGAGAPVLQVVAEFVCSEAGESDFLGHVERTLREARATPGCVDARLWSRPGRRYRFVTLWDDPEGVGRWVGNDFHRNVLMPGFREWCVEGWFADLAPTSDHPRARRCIACGRWTRSDRGWDEMQPDICRHCGARLTTAEPSALG